MLFVRLIEQLGYIATPSKNGREALREIRRREYELIILDLSLPEMDGLELMRRSRSDYPWIKLLVVSGFMRGSMLEVARKLGADGVLEKLLAPKMLIPTICELLAVENPRSQGRA